MPGIVAFIREKEKKYTSCSSFDAAGRFYEVPSGKERNRESSKPDVTIFPGDIGSRSQPLGSVHMDFFS